MASSSSVQLSMLDLESEIADHSTSSIRLEDPERLMTFFQPQIEASLPAPGSWVASGLREAPSPLRHPWNLAYGELTRWRTSTLPI